MDFEVANYFAANYQEEQQPIITLRAEKDAFLRNGSPNTNEGANEQLRIQASGNNRVLVGFNLSSINLSGLVSATLLMTLADNADNWGGDAPGTRHVDAHRLLVDWVEGNGYNDGSNIRGTGVGVTWNCPADDDVSNSNPDNCSGAGNSWNGGTFASATAPGVLHYNGLAGQLSWDVTQDVLNGAVFGWIIKKRNEGQSGKVYYYSREGAPTPDDMPTLILNFSNGNKVIYPNNDYRNKSHTLDNIVTLSTDIDEVNTDKPEVKKETKFDILKMQAKAFPNPSYGMLTLEKEGQYHYQVRDVLGRMLLQGNFNNSKQIEISEDGLYFITLTGENKEVETLKVIIQK
jgi:hypothetical protein